jgi:tetratricopeptide (TPR) repeat protein
MQTPRFFSRNLSPQQPAPATAQEADRSHEPEASREANTPRATQAPVSTGNLQETINTYLEEDFMRVEQDGVSHPNRVQGLIRLAYAYHRDYQASACMQILRQVEQVYLEVEAELAPDIIALYQQMKRLTRTRPPKAKHALENEAEVQVAKLEQQAYLLEKAEELYLAHEMYLRALQQARQATHDTHPRVQGLLHKFADFCYRYGLYDEAADYFQQESELLKRWEAEAQGISLLGQSLDQLGAAMEKLNRWEEATSTYLTAFDLRQRHLGDTHPDTLRTKEVLANFYCRQYDWEAAQAAYSWLYERVKALHSASHPEAKRLAAKVRQLTQSN